MAHRVNEGSPPALVTKCAKEAEALAADKRAAAAFKAMMPGGQREYANYVNEAKQSPTRDRRVEKILPMIAAGGGLNDRYKKNG